MAAVGDIISATTFGICVRDRERYKWSMWILS
jgi:hypothetical protein